MPLRRIVAAAAVAAAAPVVWVPSAAFAADGTSIDYVEPTDEGLQVLVSVPAGSGVDLDGVTVTVDGEQAEASAAPADSSTAVRRTTVLAIDTSDSMKGQRFTAAKAAALTFLEAVPDDVHVGIISFSGSVSAALEPTLDRDRARIVVDQLTLSRETRLYDGVLAGVDMVGTEGQRTLLVLSDGADTSDTALADVTKVVADSEVGVNVVALEQDAAAVDALGKLTDAGRGEVISADSDALRAAFTSEADELARQVLVATTIPDSVSATEATVAVTLSAADGELSAEAFTAIRKRGSNSGAAGSEPLGQVIPGLVLTDTWMYAGLGGLGLGLVVLLLMLVPSKPKPMTAAQRAASFADHATGVRRSADGEAPEDTLATFKGAADKMLKSNRSLEARIEARLEKAGNPFKSSEWLLLATGVFLTAGTVGVLVSNGSLVVGLLFLIAGVLGPWLWLGFKASRRRKAFGVALPDSLQLMSGSLAAGLSLAQSVDTIVREGVEPIASEFKRVLIETRLGVSLEDALDGVVERFDSKDFGWVVMAIRIQRQVGGNLAELLNTVAATMREREYMRRQVSALAAEGKLSAWVLGGLPPAFMLYLLVTNRDYVMVMFTEPLGWAMLAGAGLILSVGVFWMSRLVKVEI